MNKIFRNLFILAICYMVISPSTTFAYLDPGTGSYIIQILIAGAASGIFVAKIYWQKIKLFFQGRGGKKEKNAADQKQEIPDNKLR